KQAALVREAPCLHYLLGLEQEAIGSPQMQVGLVGGEFLDRQVGDRRDVHCAIVVFRGAAAGSIVVLPGRIGVNRAEQTAVVEQSLQSLGPPELSRGGTVERFGTDLCLLAEQTKQGFRFDQRARFPSSNETVRPSASLAVRAQVPVPVLCT